MPIAGLGLAGSTYREILDFLLMGGRHLDTAIIYSSARAAGQAIREAMRQGVRREEVFFTHKLNGAVMGLDGVLWAMPRMLQQSGLDYFDLVLLHGPRKELDRCLTPKRCRQESWLALQRFKSQGLVKHMGVSNYGPRQMEELLAMGGAPVEVNQLEYHPWSPQANREAVAYCHARGIAVTAYSSVSALHARPEAEVRAVSAIAAAHNRTAAQVLLRWALQHNVSVIPHSSRPQHMAQNLEVFDFALGREQMAVLDAMPPGAALHPQNRLDGDDWPPPEWGSYSLDHALPEVERQYLS